MEKKQRVPKGEKYWFVNETANIEIAIEHYSLLDSYRYNANNYFLTPEEAEVMARKLRAVLNGADVIEMPSEEEWRTEAIKIGSRNSVEYEQEDAVSYNECVSSAIEMVLWLESKIIK